MKTTALLGAAAMAACMGLTGAAGAAESFDGRWAVQLKTESGSCDRALSATVGVQGGHISDSGILISTSGTVDGRGHVALQMSGAGHTLAASGTLAHEGGAGTWVSPSHQCAGRWFASRQ